MLELCAALDRRGTLPATAGRELLRISFVARCARGRFHLFRILRMARRRGALRFELSSDTHHEDLRLAVRLDREVLRRAWWSGGDFLPAAFVGAMLRLLSDAAGERLSSLVLLEALERETRPRRRDGWQVRRTSPGMGVMYLESPPTNMGDVGGGKALVRTSWVGEQLRDVAGRFDRERAEEIARRLDEDGDPDRHEAVPEVREFD